MSPRSFGVEEEFLLVEPATGEAQAVAGAVMHAASTDGDPPEVLEFELQMEQLEINTRPCGAVEELGVPSGLSSCTWPPWRASRSGLEDALLDPATGKPAPARQVISALLDHVRPVLAETGDFAVVADLMEAVLARGNGAMAQRTAYGRHGSLLDVIQGALRDTVPGGE